MRSLGKRFYVLVIFVFFLVSVKSPFFAVSLSEESVWSCPAAINYKFRCSPFMSASTEPTDCSPLLEYDKAWRWAGKEYSPCMRGMGNWSACCYNPKERCNTKSYQCVSNCSSIGYPIDNQRCLVDGLQCCDVISDDNCICRTHYGGECHDESPGDGWEEFGGPWNNPCENCSGGSSCWVYDSDPDPTCGYPGLSCCPGHLYPDLPEGGCFEGLPYASNMQQCYCYPNCIHNECGEAAGCKSGELCEYDSGSNFWFCRPSLECSGEPPTGPIYNGPIIDSLEKILNPAVRVLYYGGLFVGIFFIILSGYKLMTSEGDPQRTKEAQEQLTSAIIGIIFILLSTTIIRIIMSKIIGI